MGEDRSVRHEVRSIEASRVVEAPAAQVFSFLSDPVNHVAFDTSGMVRGSTTGATIAGVDDVFVMNMHNAIKSNHQVENHIVVYEPDRAIGWAPAEPGHTPAGHTWTWRLAPAAPDRTVVSLTYDWSRFSHIEMLDHLPVINCAQLLASLDRLAEAL
ncbi:SRPBCC family protein [Pseudonocardia adelaidensis]|uniref:SRPBCC family protein n=1 Tax=Pseudonocardia adelaidensis TaxID=648754 RepID=A0ABP9NSA5_9PSEU